MKKILLVILLLLSLCACGQEKEEIIIDNDYSKLNIIAPTGAPSLAFLSEVNNPNFETNAVPQNIVAMMSETSDKQIVVIDTISGIKAINNGAPYKLAANITFGNFYIASTGNDDNKTFEPGDKIVLFGQGITPDIIFHFLYGNDYDEGIEYVSSVQDAGKCLAAGKNFETGNDIDYVFIAEPVLTSVLNNNEANTYGKVSIVKQIRKEYLNKTGLDMIQASLFIRNDSLIDVDDYLDYLESNISTLFSNQDYINSLINDSSDEEISSKYGIGKALMQNVVSTNKVGLGFRKAYSNKEAIDKYIALFNEEETSEEIYCK